MSDLKIDIDSLAPDPNIYKSKAVPEKTRLSPVVNKGSVVKKKKTLGDKFAETFLSDDISDVKRSVKFDIIIPTIKNTILNLMETAFFGIGSGRSYDGPRTNYGGAYYGSSNYGRRKMSDSRFGYSNRDYNDKKDYRNIVLKYRGDAEEVVRRLRERIEIYDRATVADLLDLIDVSSSYTDNNWGWENPNDIGLRRVSDGYLIDVAEARHLD